MHQQVSSYLSYNSWCTQCTNDCCRYGNNRHIVGAGHGVPHCAANVTTWANWKFDVCAKQTLILFQHSELLLLSSLYRLSVLLQDCDWQCASAMAEHSGNTESSVFRRLEAVPIHLRQLTTCKMAWYLPAYWMKRFHDTKKKEISVVAVLLHRIIFGEHWFILCMQITPVTFPTLCN